MKIREKETRSSFKLLLSCRVIFALLADRFHPAGKLPASQQDFMMAAQAFQADICAQTHDFEACPGMV